MSTRPEELLRAVPLFAPLPEAAVQHLAEEAESLSFGRGSVICRQGDPGGSLFVVGSGQVEIVLEEEGDETRLATLSPGEFFGELALLDGEPRSATAKALSDCTCLVIHRTQFFSILREPHVLENLLSVLAGRVRAADQIIGSRSIDNRKLQEEVLTSLGNRRKLYRDLQTLEAWARRYSQTFALAMCDIDNFKRYNDTYGHAKGDEALRAVAQSMAHHCRGGDEVYRYGGEEFVVVMPSQSAEGAAIGMERLRKSVEDLGIPHTGNPPHNLLTFSGGITLVSKDTTVSATEALQVADEALYQAKHEGRNRVALAPLKVSG